MIAALGLPGTLYLGSTAVPITLQTLGVMLAGAILGARKGLAAVAVFEVLVLAGLPLLAGGRGGPQYFTVSPSAGYLYGFLAGVVVIGLLTARILPAYPLWQGIAVTALGGIVVVYAFGIPWTAAVLHLPLWTACGGLAEVPARRRDQGGGDRGGGQAGAPRLPRVDQTDGPPRPGSRWIRPGDPAGTDPAGADPAGADAVGTDGHDG